jgi:hypothetical protein
MTTLEAPVSARAGLAWLPVALLVGVALTHAYRVEVFDLTPWKGGGFGMFSTLDGRDNRRLIVSLVQRRADKKREVAVDLPTKGSVRQLAEKAQAMPTEERLRLLAEAIAKQPWRIGDSRPADGTNNARIVQDKAKQAGTRLVPFDTVEVGVWKLQFERKDGMVSTTPELVRRVSATRPGSPALRGGRP